MQLAAVVLAAGKGTRMKSATVKVLHQVCGRAMIEHVLAAVQETGVQKTVLVIGQQGEQVMELLGSRVEYARQDEQLGTAHALMQTRPVLEGLADDVLVVCGDTPLLRPQTLAELCRRHKAGNNAATVLTAILNDPAGYGRVIRSTDGMVQKIVEQKDAAPDELAVQEVNTGVYCFRLPGLFEALAALQPNNAQGEYYLTDIIGYYADRGASVGAVAVDDPADVAGVNDRCQLAAAEKILRRRVLERVMLSGVTVLDPDNTYIDTTASIGMDTVIYPFTFVEGKSKIGENCIIGPASRLVDTDLGCRVTVQNSVVVGSSIGDGCNIGPFAYIRPGCVLGREVKVGDFVELKKAFLGDGTKVPHLSYVGDADVGKAVNIGAGTITCNYDGQKKSVTRIGDGAFIGSNTNLVAPLEVGTGAVTGAGSTITRDVPPGALGVARDKQKNIPDWSTRRKRPCAQNKSE